MGYDVAVVGLGAAGSAALWGLARRGASVVGIDPFGIAHDRGSSHGRSRLFRGGASEGPAYVDLAAQSLELWRDMEARTGQEIVTLTSGLTIAAGTSELFTSTRAALESRGMPYELLDADQLRRRYPQHRIADHDLGILDPATGVVRPEVAVSSAIRLAQQHGAEVRASVAVESVAEAGDGIAVRLSDGEDVHAKRVVLSAGAWNDRVLPGLPTPFTVRRAVLTWFEPRAGSEERFLPRNFPVFSRLEEHEQGWGAPMIDEFGVKVGLHDQDNFVIEDPSANTREVRPEEVRRVQAFVARQLPDLVPTAVHAKGCMITLTPDEHFSIGELDSHPGVVLLAACSGHGFKHSAAVGDLGAAIALRQEPAQDISLFDPNRFSVRI